MKKYLRSIILSTVLFVIFCIIGYISNLVYELSIKGGHAYSLVLYSFLQFSFGLLLGFEKFRMNIKNNGFWKINLFRLFSFGLPSLLVGMFIYLYYFDIPILKDITSILSPFLSNSFIQMLGQISFGYILITCIYKNEMKQTL